VVVVVVEGCGGGGVLLPLTTSTTPYLYCYYYFYLPLRQAVDDLAQAGLQPACNRWSYAASREGRMQLASVLSDEAASRFLLEE
tara:strand:- start:343 stop:594 length:252 start_codon:yes stop_codon:yes gene_type:complete